MMPFNYANKILLGEKIDIVFITDEQFVMPTAIAISSLYVNRNKNVQYNINIVCTELMEESIMQLQSLSNEKFCIKVIDFSFSDIHNQFEKRGYPVSKAATLKFSLPNLLTDIDKVLYIDGDILIQSDLCELFFSDIENVYAGVVKDYHAMTFKGNIWERLGIKLDGYFNSGVLLLNLALMRQDNISRQLIDYRLNGINYFMDQDALNVVLNGNVKFLDFKYNATLTNWRNKTSEDLAKYYDMQIEQDKYNYLRRAHIVHFCSSDKPWIYYDTHYADIWIDYFLSSPLACKYLLQRQSLHSIIHSADIAKIRIQPDAVCKDNYNLYADNNRSPYITVIIPVYNAEKYLSDCLNSVFTQTLGNIEVVCIDDGSSDSSGKILEEWALFEPRLKIIHQENKFAGAARNYGIAVATGEYIAFLDADDCLTHNALECYMSNAAFSSADVIVAGICSFEKEINNAKKLNNWLDESCIPSYDFFSSSDIMPFVFNFTTGGPCGKCFSKKYIDIEKLRFLTIAKSEDFYFIHLGIAKAKKIAVIRDHIYYKRNVQESLENKKDLNPLAFWEAIMLFKSKLQEDGLYQNVKQSFINVNIDRFTYNLKTMNTEIGYKTVLDKLREVNESELGLGIFPRKYYYRQDNYEYLCKLLGIDFKPLVALPANNIKKSVKEQNKKENILQGKKVKSEADLIRESISYRIGRFITYIPRKMRAGIRCYKKHGMGYTLGQIKTKFIGLFGCSRPETKR